jgi:hypothetical protein
VIYGHQKPGRPTDLTEEKELAIRKLVLEGLRYVQVREKLAIPKGTWDAWVHGNYSGFRANLKEWKKELLVNAAEDFSKELMSLSHEQDGKVIDGVLRVKQKESEFLRSTLGKDEGYTTRSELTGKDGEPLAVSDEHQQAANIAITKYLNGGTGNPSQ